MHDIDLSVIGMGEDGSQYEFSWRTMASLQSDAVTYSGDETSGYRGGSEYFDIDPEKIREMYPEMKYLVFCDNVYTGIPFTSCFCKAGYMLRDTMDSGEVFEPKTVQTSFKIDCDSIFAYLFAIDLEASELIWLNTVRDSTEIVAGETSLGFLMKYFDMTSVMNVYKLFSMMATELVDTAAEAEVVVSDTVAKTAEGAEIIRSSDVERIMALMN